MNVWFESTVHPLVNILSVSDQLVSDHIWSLFDHSEMYPFQKRQLSCSRGLVWADQQPPPSCQLHPPTTRFAPDMDFSIVSAVWGLVHCPTPDLIQENMFASVKVWFKWKSLLLWASTQRSLSDNWFKQNPFFSDSRQTIKEIKVEHGNFQCFGQFRFTWQAPILRFGSFDLFVNSCQDELQQLCENRQRSNANYLSN